MGAFGEKLRRQRERRGLTLDAISTTTKISPRMLSAIEEERFDQLPGGVFNKGFVRAYARQVGLNEEQTVTDYLDALAESQMHAQAILPNFRNIPAPLLPKPENAAPNVVAGVPRDKNAPPERRTLSDRRSASRRVDDRLGDPSHNLAEHEPVHRDEHTPVVPVAVDHTHEDYVAKKEVAAVESVGGVVEGDREEESFEDAPSMPPSFLHLSDPSVPSAYSEAFVPEAAPPYTPRPIHWQRVAIPLVMVTLVLALWAFYRSHHPASDSQPMAASDSAAPVSPATSSQDVSSPTAAAPVTGTPVVPAPQASSITTQANAALASPKPHPSRPESASDVTKITLPTQRATKPAPLPKFTLTIRASQTSWVSITADGQPVATETLFAPANTSVRAQHEITVKTRNAGGVSFMLNGKELAAQGAPGEAHTYTFDARGLRDSSAASSLNRTN